MAKSKLDIATVTEWITSLTNNEQLEVFSKVKACVYLNLQNHQDKLKNEVTELQQHLEHIGWDDK